MNALALFSGGLDSSLAIRIVQDEGIEIIGVHFTTPFCTCSGPAAVARELDIDFKRVPLGSEFLEIVKKPPHGYGRNLNPCIDCRILMLRRSKEIMKESLASFIITGEVLGQRPMSQNRNALFEVEKASGLNRLILRPLSAKLLPVTIPEERNWVRRGNLLAIEGRSRRKQLELAQRFGIRDFSTPSGGCLLTDPIFCRKVKDLIKHDNFTENHIILLRVGRHFRLGNNKLIVGRNQQENRILKDLSSGDNTILEPEAIPGPTAVIVGKPNDNEIRLSARIVARYSDHCSNPVVITVISDVKASKVVSTPLEDEKINKIRI